MGYAFLPAGAVVVGANQMRGLPKDGSTSSRGTKLRVGASKQVRSSRRVGANGTSCVWVERSANVEINGMKGVECFDCYSDLEAMPKWYVGGVSFDSVFFIKSISRN